MRLTVAIIGASHGLKGEVRLNVRTDIPDERFVVGSVFETDPPEAGPLTIERTRPHKGVTYALFAECADRSAAENLRGVKLLIDTDKDEYVEDDAYYLHELRGLEALDPDGYTLGEVVGIEPSPAHDLLLVREIDGIITRVPFVSQIVTEVDLDDHCVVIDAPAGLFSYDGEE
ncbi:MAG: ribosome maturation factor RimM [Actinomycetaceae bacterium]|nr:ribosome maturation factor RimM [Actinomycetaceae bacterium]